MELGFPDGSVGKESACNSGDTGDEGSIPGSGRSLGVGNSNPLQFSCLENPMDGGAWWATVHGVPVVGHDSVSEHRCTGRLTAAAQMPPEAECGGDAVKLRQAGGP